MSELTRRDFMRLTLAGAGAVITGAVTPLRGGWAVPSSPPDLVIARGESAVAITEAGLETAGGMGRFVSRGDVVLVKPNIGWDRTPEQAANTNPEVIGTLVRLCAEAGAREVKVFDHPCEDPRRTYVRSGIMEAAKKAGAQVTYMDERRYRKVDLKGDVLKSWEVYREALEVDAIINVPILKHHSLARLTMGMKNLMGLIGGSRSRLHWQLDASIVDLAAFFKPTLVVLDAVRILTASGPQGGSLKHVKKVNTVAIGTDQVAVDAAGAALFGLVPEELGHLPLAQARGLGTWDLAKLRVKEVNVDS